MAWTEQDARALEEALKGYGLNDGEVKRAMSAPEPKEYDPNAQCVTQHDMDYLKRKLAQPPKSYIWRRKKK